ncbi:MAG: endolytic transglycosylase MltG [Catonella sp.]|uniref:endolytic transglycosylase MltG n=1 Tax=Catonella sp. TaxID=2382125 RepID=UPI003F9F1907
MAAGRRTGRIVLNIFGAIIHIFLNIIFYMVIVYMVIKASHYVYDFAYQVFGSVSVTKDSGYTTELTINKGESTMEVARLLEAKKVIPNKYSFYVRAKLTKLNILPGTYKVSSDMDYDRIFKVITTPNKSTEKKK